MILYIPFTSTGGKTDGTPSGRIYSLDGSTWKIIGTLKTERRLHACVVKGKYLYIAGGMKAGGKKLSSTEILDMETRELLSGPPLPWAASSPQAFVYNGTIYMVARNGKWGKLEKDGNVWINFSNNKYNSKMRQVFPSQLVGNKIINK